MEFNVGQRVVFRESETGPAEYGYVEAEYPADGFFTRHEVFVRLDGGTSVMAHVAEVSIPTN